MLFEKQLSELESYLPQMEVTNPKISSSTVGWQIDHALRVVRGISWQLEESNPNDFKGKFNFQKSFILLTGYIPRGRARAPKDVKNDKEITAESINDFLGKTKIQISKVEGLDKKAHFPHPIFGQLDKKEAIRFIEIHTNHHLKIIRDMLKK